MIEYTFELVEKESGNSFKYRVKLKLHEENNPELFFTLEIQDSMRNNLEKQSACKISDVHLNKIISTWIEDIKEGYRYTNMTLELPYLMEANCIKIIDSGYQQIPNLMKPDLSEIEPQIGCLPILNFI